MEKARLNMWSVKQGSFGMRGVLFVLVTVGVLALLTSCQTTEPPLSGNFRIVGESMKAVVHRSYQGHCLSDFLLPLQFSGALEGTAIVSETIAVNSSCLFAPTADVDSRHMVGTFTGNVEGHTGSFDFVLDAAVQTGDVMNGQLSVTSATAIGELAGLEMTLAIRGHGKVPVVAYEGNYRLASGVASGSSSGENSEVAAGIMPRVALRLTPGVAPRLAPRVAPGVAARIPLEQEAADPPSQPYTDNSPYAAVEQQIDDMLRDGQVPGLAMAVVKGDKAVYLKTFGVMNVESSQRIMPTTDFGLASVAKTVTALAIMQLVQTGKVDLDAPVTKYLPYFTLADDRYQEITIRQLLSHTSGMPGTVDVPLPLTGLSSSPAGGELESYVRGLKNSYLYFAPGTGWAYSSVGYDVLGDVVAQVSGMSFEEYVTQKIFVPLGMTDTVFFSEDVPVSNLAMPYVVGNGGKPVVIEDSTYRHIRTPSSYLYSNLADLTRLLAVDLNGGILDGVRIINSAAYETMWKPVATTTFAYPTATQYGLGWMIADYNGQRVISHFGVQPGYNAFVALLPEQKTGLIILTNFADERGKIDDPALAIAEPMLDLLTTLPAGQP